MTSGNGEHRTRERPVQPASLVLVVDDEYPIVELLCMVLEDEGFRVTGKTSGSEAVKSIQADRPDIILTDVMMPGMTGYELARVAASIDPDIRVVFMSAVVDPPESIGQPFLPKPFDLSAVIDVVDEQLQAS